MTESTIKRNDSSLDDVMSTQKQLDEELQQLKNRYSRYTQLVSYQQEEEDYLLKNKENVNPEHVSLTLKRKKDVTYGLMPHDDIEIIKNQKPKKEEKKSMEEMTKTANSFLDSLKEKAKIKPKEFELPPPVPKEKESEEKVEEEEEEEEEYQDKNMNRLCDLVQSLLSEAQEAIDKKPELNHPDIGKEEEEVKLHHSNSIQNFDSSDESTSVSNKHLSIMTDSTAIAQPLAPVNTYDIDDYDNMNKYDGLRSPYNAMASSPNMEYRKNVNSTMGEEMYYPPKYYPPPELYYGGPSGYPPYFDPAFGPIPPYLWEEIQKQRMNLNLNGEGSTTSNPTNPSKDGQNQDQDQNIDKNKISNPTEEDKDDKKSKEEEKSSVKKRRRRKHHHHKHIRPVDADGNLGDPKNCPIHSKALVKKEAPKSKSLFKAQFGSDTQLFLSFFASFFVTSILVTISCLWSVIQVMAGNVNDQKLSRLLMSSSENAIKSNKKKINQILDKDSSESLNSDSESEEEEDSETEESTKLLTDGSCSSSTGKFITAPSLTDDEEEEEEIDEDIIKIPSNFNSTLINSNNQIYSSSLKNSISNINTHRRRNSL